jgi:hypothetical protein
VHLLHTLWFGYFKPSLLSNGPEALVQTVVYALIAVAVWPPARRAVRRFVTAREQEAERLAAHNKWMATHLARQLDAQGIRVDPHPEHGDLVAGEHAAPPGHDALTGSTG